ncbi:PP2C family protein-serine/threonine phosphatase [Litorivivens sp.]|uniref:PP2C family protein-serine/threonine phosphatase n=2 Tax=Litorivivens sp. TaxID=2020868 RepID=UPI003561F981
MATAKCAKRLIIIQRADAQRDELQAALERQGYEVDAYGSGEEGVQAFMENTVSAVLLDLYVSDNGRGILEILTSDRREIPVIVISRRRLMADVVEALRKGACDYLMITSNIGDDKLLGHAMERAMQQGALRRENREYRDKLEAANRELLESLSHLKKDQQAGRHIQLKMLPETPKIIGNYRFHQHILPSLYLSGDFIDYFIVGDRYAVFFVADVSGHGASSAFVTVMLKNLFARKRSDFHHRHNSAILSPAHMLDKANRELLGMEIDKHVTMCVGVIDLHSDELCYSIAGHLPAPIISVDGVARYLEGHDLPVGLFPEVTYSEHRMALPPKAVLTLFSDGILEVLNPKGVIAKEQYLLEALEDGPQTADDVVNTFKLDTIEEAPDDIAVLVVSRV